MNGEERGWNMPKGRMLNKKISYDERLAQLSLSGALIYTWSIPHLDVEGRIYGESRIIKGLVCPFRNDITIGLITKNIEKMGELGLVTIYERKGVKYLQFNGFSSNQRIDKTREATSDIPAPTDEEIKSNSGVTPQQVKLSKVKISKFPAKQGNQEEMDIILASKIKKIHKFGINISQITNAFKKKQRERKATVGIPNEVLINVCDCILMQVDGGKLPEHPYPYFLRTLQDQLGKYIANQNVKASQGYKTRPDAIKDLVDNEIQALRK